MIQSDLRFTVDLIPQDVLAKKPSSDAADARNDNPLKTPESKKKAKRGTDDAFPAVLLSADVRVGDENLAATFQSGMLALMGQIHHNHLMEAVEMVRLRGGQHSKRDEIRWVVPFMGKVARRQCTLHAPPPWLPDTILMDDLSGSEHSLGVPNRRKTASDR